MKKILLVEDDPNLGLLLQDYLQLKGKFDVVLCTDGEEGIKAFNKQNFDLCILDVMMPKKDGFSVANDVRKINKKIPIIFLTAKSQTQDVVEGFNAGGNDYLKKPFSMEELIIRIHSLLGRITSEKITEKIAIGTYIFNFTKQTLHFSERVVNLTHREAQLLLVLLENKNEILDRSVVLKKIWGNDDFFNGRSMDVFITKLRKKLNLDPNIHIINVRGQGYKLIC